jgi:cytochrome c-type biogenesis protein CcmE
VNSRARNRLIGVTAIILIVIAAIFFGSNRNAGAYYKTVAEIAKDQSLVGRQVYVGGPVVQGSWDKKTRPMTFSIVDTVGPTGAAVGPQLKVVYGGNIPQTFGDGVVAIVKGQLGQDGVVTATELTTKCPEKTEESRGAMTVDALEKSAAQIAGVPLGVTGFVVPGSLVGADASGPRFYIQTKDGKAKAAVVFSGGTPAGFKDGMQVVVNGVVDASGTLTATSVALSK